ncbi:histone-lysine N-methyltransferase ATXR2 [Pistacia vera]|uniref:histone-lysine N-methyltransferase ATXR2 n=1 Tax=Pistacia vera TaxID=55513 RepID=UPI001263C893|nr:histone-lysine N-methyltransferase ATXR2 [Pistacia vera]
MQSGAEERCFSEMASVCPIDEKCASQVSSLLQPPSPLQVQDYFDNLISTRPSQGIKVHQNTHLGRGVYAEVDFREEELVLKDQMLVGIQHSSNKVDCLVCSFCFRFIGSIELQIGRKLYLQNLGVSANDCCDMETSSHVSNNCFDTVSSDMEDESQVKNHQNLENCASSSSKDNISLPNGVVESLMNGELVLPYSNKFPLPSAVSCSGGCKEAYYCSKSCAETDWELFHSILCTGERSESPSREALSKFIQHANGTNDIFLLAAKAISFTILRYTKLKAAHQGGKHTSPDALDSSDLSLLLEAWKPISMGYKRRWWDCIALPDDVDYSDEASFRKQIKELAFTSLKLLKEAIFEKECEPLFSLDVYGHIIGMFELNNLDLVVASPVEDFFLYIDDLPYPEKKEAELVTRPILDSLGDDYSICCQGTAFFPLQSCMNHSCCPNAKAFKREEDRDGQATIIARGPISKGEEVTISYIDEDLPYEERQALLADYGFKCRCPKCLKEES